jgi:hypothetical protein
MANLAIPDLVAAIIVIAAIAALYVLTGGGWRPRARKTFRPYVAWNSQPFEARGSRSPPMPQARSIVPIPVTEADLAVVSRHMAAVMQSGFERRRILNRSEHRVFCIVERALRAHKGCRVFPQTCLGEVLQSPDKDAFMAINAKRVDLLIVDAAGWPLLAIEYQGEGHYQGVAIARDAIKKEALRKAGVSYLEVLSGDSDDRIVAGVHELLGARSQAKALSR